jgi:hypothetical protein
MGITGWYDDRVREKALQSMSEVFYYMVHATHAEERRHWAVEYTKMLENEDYECVSGIYSKYSMV